MNNLGFMRRMLALSFAILAGIGHAETTNLFSFDEMLVAAVRVHLLSASNSPAIKTSLTEQDAARIFGKLNRVWGLAGIHFCVESIVREQASHDTPADGEKQLDRSALLALRPKESRATNMFHVYYIREMSVNGIYFQEGIFVKDTASLRKVEGGIDEPLPRVTSHELGHALGLDHRQNTTNLMASGTTGTWLNEEEIQRARQTTKKYEWIQPASLLMKQADALFEKDKKAEAAVLYGRLATIALPAEQVALARKRAHLSSQ